MKLKLIAALTASSLFLGGCVIAVNPDSHTISRAEDDSYKYQDDRAYTQAQENSSRVFSAPYISKRLDNGLQVYVVKTDYPDVVAINIPVSTGSRNEVEEGKTGFAHFFEHMMFKGTPTYSTEEYRKVLKNAGVDNRASTSDDYTIYRTVFSKEHLEKMVSIEADRFQNLVYTDAQFKTEALTIKGEYLKNNASAIRKLLAAARGEAFSQHTYKHTTMGTFADIENMPNQLEYAKVFFDRFYRPEYTSIIIAGDVDPEQTIELVEKYWGQWQRGNYVADIKKEPRQSESKYRHVKFEGLPGHWLLQGFRGPAFNPKQKDKPSVDLMAELYFAQTSDLYQHLVVDTQKVQNFFYYFPDRKDPQLLYFAAKIEKAEDVNYVREQIAKTLAKARTELVDEQKLADLKSNLRYSFINRLDSSETIARTLSSYVHFNRDIKDINRQYATFDRISPSDVRKAANRYFVDQNRTTISMSAGDSMAQFETDILISDNLSKGDKPQVAQFKWLDKSTNSPIVDVSWLFNTGAAADPQGKKGLAALTALMVAQAGSQSKSYKDIQLAMFPLAGNFSSQLDKEMTVFRGRVHADNAEQWQKLVMDMLLNPGWREEDFTRLKTQLMDSITNGLRSANDEELGKEVLYSKLYQGHPYESYNYGDLSDLDSLTLDDVKAFYASQYTQAKLTVGVTGAIPESVKAQIKQGLIALPVGDSKRLTIPDTPKLKGRHVTIVEKSAKSTAVSFGFPIDTVRSDKDWVALWLMRSYFGEHRSSNSFLYSRIRAARGMNYGDYAYVEYFPRGMFQTKPDANLGRSEQIFQVWLRPLTGNNDAHFATRVAMYELDKLIKEGMSEEDFNTTKNFLYNFVPQLVASQDRLLGYSLDSKFYQTDEFVEYVRKGLDKLTVDDVNRAIRENLQTDNIHYVFITGDGKDMQDRLVNETISPMKYNSAKSDALLTEDKILEKLKLNLKSANVEVVSVESVFE